MEKEDKKKKKDKKNKDKKKMGKKKKLPQNGKWLFFFLLAGPAPSIILHQWSSLLELLSNPFTPRYTSLKPLNWKKWGGGSPAKDPPNISQPSNSSKYHISVLTHMLKETISHPIFEIVFLYSALQLSTRNVFRLFKKLLSQSTHEHLMQKHVFGLCKKFKHVKDQMH